MWRASLLGAVALLLTGVGASAFTAYVSNEKSNTISVIDTDKFQVVKTIKVGQRPRGIELTKDEKFVLVAVGTDDPLALTALMYALLALTGALEGAYWHWKRSQPESGEQHSGPAQAPGQAIAARAH